MSGCHYPSPTPPERDRRYQHKVSLVVRYFMIPCNICLILLATSTLGFAVLLFLNNYSGFGRVVAQSSGALVNCDRCIGLAFVFGCSFGDVPSQTASLHAGPASRCVPSSHLDVLQYRSANTGQEQSSKETKTKILARKERPGVGRSCKVHRYLLLIPCDSA
ncbi:hypothetical protein F2P81_012040 [Scophthalmus maximus]|uniref:Agrin n=1 Tax=Scophthalmus maximus TaxID=52904 RepID=A0A6A4SX83_SCOMX|nr:hypothetical protein F2P81_012040 [Scophthalmus maximus]